MATPPIDPATQARIDALQAQVDKLSARDRVSSSKSGLDTATDFINNDKISAKIMSSLNLLPTSITSSPIFQKTVGKITEAAGLVGAIADQAVESADAVFNMYQSGVAIGMDQLSSTANSFGIQIDSLTKLLAKHGRVVSTMGIDATAQLGRAFLKMTNYGANLGMSLDEANEAALSYAEIVNNSGRMQNFNSNLLAQGAISFTKALNDAAQASGRNVEQIKAETTSRLSRYDAFIIEQSMDAATQMQFEASMTAMAGFNTAANETGNQLQDYMVQYYSTGNGGSLAGIQDQNFLKALSAATDKNGGPGALELFDRAMHETGQQQKNTLVEMAALMKENLGPLSSQLKSNPEMMKIMADIARDVVPNAAKKSEPVDKTAAAIEGTVAQFEAAGNAINNSVNDLAVSGFKTFNTQLDVAADAATEFSTKISNASRYMLQNPVSTGTAEAMGIGALGLSAIIGNYLSPMFGSYGAGPGGRPDSGGSVAALAEEEASAASRSLNPSTFGRLLRGLGLGWLVDQGGQMASGAGFPRVGAGMQAGAEVYMGKIGGEIAGGILGGFVKQPELGAKIGAAIGMGIASYLNLDNIRTAIFGPTPVTNTTNTTQPELTTDNNTNTQAEISSAAAQAQADRDSIRQQNLDMNNKLDTMVTQLMLLNTNITEQTTALRNAFGRGGNNVYP